MRSYGSEYWLKNKEKITAQRQATGIEKDAAWAPSTGIFGATTGLDHRLFDEQHELRPEVYRDIMERLDRCLRVDSGLAGSDWQEWLKVYIAGGSASEWAGNRPNDAAQDLDVLVGADYAKARGYSAFEGMDDRQADAALNAAFRGCFNDPAWQAPFGGTWSLTAYANPDAWDIRAIRPYAAYDVSDMKWAVKPPHLPGHTLADFDPATLAHARAVLAEARSILKMPEPVRTREAKALWEHVHEHRCQAFSEIGQGWTDPGNVDEKYLAYAPGDVLGRIRELALTKTAAAGLPEQGSQLGYLYHSTPYRNGFPYDEWMHMGTQAAAEHRARLARPKDYGLPEDTPVYMHKAQVRGKIYPHVLSDDVATELTGNGYPVDDVDEGLPSGRGYHIFPYKNETEDPGSLSYLVHRSAIIPRESEVLPRSKFPAAQNEKTAAAPFSGIVHRGIPLSLPQDLHDYVHDTSVPAPERAQALMDHVRKRHVGYAWSDDAKLAGNYAMTKDADYSKGSSDAQTPVILHARVPAREHFEEDPDILRKRDEKSGYDTERPYPDPGQQEIHLRDQAPVQVTGISWAPPGYTGIERAPHADPAWTHHDFGRHIEVTAAAGHVPADEPAVRTVNDLGWDDDEWAAARREPWHASAKLAQREVRASHPKLTMEFPHGDEGDEMVGHMLRYAGYPAEYTAGSFVSRHPHPERMTSNPAWLNGRPGVTLHPDRWDYGTVAHESAHHAVMYNHAIGPNEPQSDEQVHGPEWAQHYASGLNRISKSAGDDFLYHHQRFRDMITDGLQWKRPRDLDAADQRQRLRLAEGSIDFHAPVRWTCPDCGHYPEDHPKFGQLYHASSPVNRNSIRDTGLRMEFDNGEGSTEPGIYMSPQPSPSEHEDVWEVNTSGLHLHPDDPGNMHEFRDVGGSYFSKQDIPPDRLRLHRAGVGNKWIGFPPKESALDGSLSRGSNPQLTYRHSDFTDAMGPAHQIDAYHPEHGQVGYAETREKEGPGGPHVEISRLWTNREHRGTGTGSALLGEVERHYKGRELRLKPWPEDDEVEEDDPDYQDESDLRGYYEHRGFRDRSAPEGEQGQHGYMTKQAGTEKPVKTKDQVSYREATGRKRCGTCTMIRVLPPDFESHHCTLVKGLIDPYDVCDEWYPDKDHAPTGKTSSLEDGADAATHVGSSPVLYHSGGREFPGDEEWVHLGTRESALNRAKDRTKERRQRGDVAVPVYMHHVKLSSDAKQPSGPEQDATVNQPDVGRHFLDHGYTAVPYVNEYEDPGTISYLAHHSAIHLVKTEPLMAKEAVTGYTGLTGRTAMIYLELPEGLVKHVPGGVDDHHITLVYLGKNVSDAAFGEACRRAQAAAAQASPLIGFLAGIETFEPSDGKVPAFVPAYLPGIGRLRAALEDLNASQYRQYRPHVTLAYLAPEDELPEPHPKVDVRFSRLHVKRGDDVVSFPLGHP